MSDWRCWCCQVWDNRILGCSIVFAIINAKRDGLIPSQQAFKFKFKIWIWMSVEWKWDRVCLPQQTQIHLYLGLYSLSGRSITARSREVSKPRDSSLKISNCSESWLAPRQHLCRDACEISERYNHYNNQSRSFETSWEMAVKRLTA